MHSSLIAKRIGILNTEKMEVRSRGFHNRERFANATLFHFGGLDLYPDDLPA